MKRARRVKRDERGIGSSGGVEGEKTRSGLCFEGLMRYMICLLVYKYTYVCEVLMTYNKPESAMTTWRPRMYRLFEAIFSSLSLSMSSSCSAIYGENDYRKYELGPYLVHPTHNCRLHYLL